MTHKWALPIIVISQFLCTSLWFAGNAVMLDMIKDFQPIDTALGDITSAVQFGFIIGTMMYALFNIADRFSPSSVFLWSAIAGASCNLGMIIPDLDFSKIIGLRFMTGFFLAGIYPVGMKIAADYYKAGLGKSLGFLVGALVLGTAFPHLLKGSTTTLPWQFVLVFTSGLAVLGGLLIFIKVPDGPYRKSAGTFAFSTLFKVFKNRNFRSAAFGYFGHMWELYAFWAFVPLILTTYMSKHPETHFNIPLLSFLIIGSGGIACVFSGYISQWLGAKRTAAIMLFLSLMCCIGSPLLFYMSTDAVFVGFLIFWGMVVVADSPMFSTVVARNAVAEAKATALTIVNSIGFAITILSIQGITRLQEIIPPEYIYLLLALGPFFGLMALHKARRQL